MGKDKDKRRRDDSSSDDSSDDDRRGGSKGGNKKDKKQKETREEKMKRRNLKRAMKRIKEEERKTICGYTDENNRFGDSSLTQAFAWHKKEATVDEGSSAAKKHQVSEKMKRHQESERKRKIEEDLFRAESRVPVSEKMKRHQESERKRKIEEEVEKVKKRRDDREEEAAWLEEEKARASRQQEEEQHADWERKADEFHLKQAHQRSKIRINEGRAKPIDMLAKNLISDDHDVEMAEPYKIFRGLSVPLLEELQTDIDLHQGFDQENAEFWDAMVIVCEDEIQSARRRIAGGSDLDNEGVHASIYQDMVKQLNGKSLTDLEEQEGQIQAMIGSDDVADTEFWETVLKRLNVAKAKARLKEIHEAILRRRLDSIESGQVKVALSYPEKKPAEEEESAVPEEVMSDVEVDEDSDEEDGSFSPVLHAGDDADAVDPEEDRKQMEEQRRKVLQMEALKLSGQATASAAASKSGLLATDARDDAFFSANKGKDGPLGEDEAVFSGEVSLDQQVYAWHDKYRPRKPRFFNRVHTGYEWNKYNQTHYDHDNPPPKVVQGYKFNIFYPDLIDKSKAPTFSLENDSSPETRILRFTAGPPYEDLAFRVVAKEWEFSHKRGFKCTFDRGILHLYFNFKRYRYRK